MKLSNKPKKKQKHECFHTIQSVFALNGFFSLNCGIYWTFTFYTHFQSHVNQVPKSFVMQKIIQFYCLAENINITLTVCCWPRHIIHAWLIIAFNIRRTNFTPCDRINFYFQHSSKALNFFLFLLLYKHTVHIHAHLISLTERKIPCIAVQFPIRQVFIYIKKFYFQTPNAMYLNKHLIIDVIN